ncbi:putative SbcC-like protein [Erwinia phage vB_EamM_MadMel]|uniref:Putative SbcC-like protein n=1 Tax=Erwinia phage vB_EamM_MadMel TaxID=2060128 RepID=A0A2H5BJG6_9CAUD|nr:putative SbcC-like protein [Erwinia phage vB_EamM_MadMel]
MLIKFIELYNYQRLKNKGINRITMTFSEVVQVILGKNGSGKSSLIRELSPLPPANDEYDKDGYKHIVIEHKGAEYELYSQPGSPSRHTFKRNGEDLNESMTMNAQKILVKEHFGYTAEIHEVLLGMVNGVSFTSMTPQKRREWFTLLHPTDLSYVIELHQVLKVMLRDAKGGIKTSNQHLTDLYGQRQEGVTVEAQQSQLDDIQHRRDRIARFISDELAGKNFKQELDNDMYRLKDIGERFQANPPLLSRNYRSREDILTELENCRAELGKLEYAHKTHSNELAELSKNEIFTSGNAEKDKAELEASKLAIAEHLEQSRAAHADAMNRLGDNPLWQKMYSMPFEQVRVVLSQVENLIDHLLRMVPMDERKNTLMFYDRARRSQYDLQVMIEGLEQEDKKYSHQLSHFNSADKTECPSCHHRWVPGVSERQMEEVKQKHNAVNVELTTARERLGRCNAYLEANETWYQAASAYIRYTETIPECRDVFEWMLANDVLYMANREFAAILPTIKHGILSREALANDEQRLVQIDNKLKLFTNDAIEWHTRRYNEHETALSQVISQTQAINHTMAVLKKDLRLVDDSLMMAEVARVSMEGVRVNTGNLAKQAIANTANDEYRMLGDQHKSITAGLYNARSLESTILSTESHVQSMKASKDALELLVKATSPTEGIPAEQLSEFIETFVGNMNAIISDIWGDNLQIKPCNMENGDLSFKFPLISGDFEGGAKDVSDSSTGEAQIINYVFRLVVMQYLGFEQYPLVMDEAGANFDEAHRPALMNYIKRASESGVYSQIFLISHYIAQHGVLTHAEVCALSNDGVALPETYNDHVVIE